MSAEDDGPSSDSVNAKSPTKSRGAQAQQELRRIAEEAVKEPEKLPDGSRRSCRVAVPLKETAFIQEHTLFELIDPANLNSTVLHNIYEDRHDDFEEPQVLEVCFMEEGKPRVEIMFVDPLHRERRPRIIVSCEGLQAMHKALAVLSRKVDNVVMTLRVCREHYYKELLHLREMLHRKAILADQGMDLRDDPVSFFDPVQYEDMLTKEMFDARLREVTRQLEETVAVQQMEIEALKSRIAQMENSTDTKKLVDQLINLLPIDHVILMIKNALEGSKLESFYSILDRILAEHLERDADKRVEIERRCIEAEAKVENLTGLNEVQNKMIKELEERSFEAEESLRKLKDAHHELQSRVARHLEEERHVASAAAERWEAERRKEEVEEEMKELKKKLENSDDEKGQLQKEIDKLKQELEGEQGLWNISNEGVADLLRQNSSMRDAKILHDKKIQTIVNRIEKLSTDIHEELFEDFKPETREKFAVFCIKGLHPDQIADRVKTACGGEVEECANVAAAIFGQLVDPKGRSGDESPIDIPPERAFVTPLSQIAKSMLLKELGGGRNQATSPTPGKMLAPPSRSASPALSGVTERLIAEREESERNEREQAMTAREEALAAREHELEAKEARLQELEDQLEAEKEEREDMEKLDRKFENEPTESRKGKMIVDPMELQNIADQSQRLLLAAEPSSMDQAVQTDAVEISAKRESYSNDPFMRDFLARLDNDTVQEEEEMAQPNDAGELSISIPELASTDPDEPDSPTAKNGISEIVSAHSAASALAERRASIQARRQSMAKGFNNTMQNIAEDEDEPSEKLQNITEDEEAKDEEETKRENEAGSRTASKESTGSRKDSEEPIQAPVETEESRKFQKTWTRQQNTIDRQQNRIEELEKQVEDKENEIINLEERAIAQEEQALNLTARIKQFEKYAQDMTGKLKILNQENQEQESRFQQMWSQMEQLHKTEVEGCERKIQELSEAVEQLSEELIDHHTGGGGGDESDEGSNKPQPEDEPTLSGDDGESIARRRSTLNDRLSIIEQRVGDIAEKDHRESLMGRRSSRLRGSVGHDIVSQAANSVPSPRDSHGSSVDSRPSRHLGSEPLRTLNEDPAQDGKPTVIRKVVERVKIVEVPGPVYEGRIADGKPLDRELLSRSTQTNERGVTKSRASRASRDLLPDDPDASMEQTHSRAALNRKREEMEFEMAKQARGGPAAAIKHMLQETTTTSSSVNRINVESSEEEDNWSDDENLWENAEREVVYVKKSKESSCQTVMTIDTLPMLGTVFGALDASSGCSQEQLQLNKSAFIKQRQDAIDEWRVMCQRFLEHDQPEACRQWLETWARTQGFVSVVEAQANAKTAAAEAQAALQREIRNLQDAIRYQAALVKMASDNRGPQVPATAPAQASGKEAWNNKTRKKQMLTRPLKGMVSKWGNKVDNFKKKIVGQKLGEKSSPRAMQTVPPMEDTGLTLADDWSKFSSLKKDTTGANRGLVSQNGPVGIVPLQRPMAPGTAPPSSDIRVLHTHKTDSALDGVHQTLRLNTADNQRPDFGFDEEGRMPSAEVLGVLKTVLPTQISRSPSPDELQAVIGTTLVKSQQFAVKHPALGDFWMPNASQQEDRPTTAASDETASDSDQSDAEKVKNQKKKKHQDSKTSLMTSSQTTLPGSDLTRDLSISTLGATTMGQMTHEASMTSLPESVPRKSNVQETRRLMHEVESQAEPKTEKLKYPSRQVGGRHTVMSREANIEKLQASQPKILGRMSMMSRPSTTPASGGGDGLDFLRSRGKSLARTLGTVLDEDSEPFLKRGTHRGSVMGGPTVSGTLILGGTKRHSIAIRKLEAAPGETSRPGTSNARPGSTDATTSSQGRRMQSLRKSVAKVPMVPVEPPGTAPARMPGQLQASDVLADEADVYGDGADLSSLHLPEGSGEPLEDPMWHPDKGVKTNLSSSQYLNST